MLEFLKDKDLTCIIMAVIVLGISQLFKLPFKALTTKYIKTKRIRDIANISLMFIPLGLGILANWLYNTLYLSIPMNLIEGLGIGAAAITLYGALEKMFKGKQSQETTDTLQLVTNITSDGKLDKKDAAAVADFIKDLDKIK